MYNFVVVALGGLAVAAITKLAFSVFYSIQRAKQATAWGCGEAPVQPGGGLLGINYLRRMLKADQDWHWLDMLMDRHNEISTHLGRPANLFRFDIFGQRTYHTSDPKNIQALLATQFNDFGLGTMRRAIMIPMVGDGIFVQDDKAWEHSRAMLRPNFTRDQVSDLDLEEKHVQVLMRALSKTSETKGWTGEVNLQDLFFRFTMDSATEFLFGTSVDSQTQALELQHPTMVNTGISTRSHFAHAFEEASRITAQRFRCQDLYWLRNPKEYGEYNATIREFMDKYVQLALETTKNEKNLEEGAAKSKYVFSEQLAKQTRDPIELRSQLCNILVAGRDTTAGLLSFIFMNLIRHPDVFTKLRSTIVNDFGTYTSPRSISFASLKSCTYMQHVINETLRLNTITPSNLRQARRDTTLPRGGGPDGSKPVFVRKGQNIEYSIHVTHRRKDIWGPDADEFKPERWVGKKVGWEFLPFNGGPRICIGQQFALTEAAYVIVRLLQRFDRCEAAGDELSREVTWNITMTAAPGKGPIVRMREAVE